MNRKQRRASGGDTVGRGTPQVQAMMMEALRLHQGGRLAEAGQLYQQVLALDRRHAEALHRLGMIAIATGQGDSAVDLMKQAITCNGKVALYHANLGAVCFRLGRLEEAVASFRKALALQPRYPLALANMASTLYQLGRLDEAVTAFQQVITLEPGNSIALNDMGNVLRDLCRPVEALDYFRRAFQADRSYLMSASCMAVTAPLVDSFDAARMAEITREAGGYYDRAQALGTPPVFANPPDPERRLKIGYLSPGLFQHVLAGNLLPLWRAHDRSAVAVHVYAHVPRPDTMTERLKDAADHWTYVHEMSDEQLAQRIRSDGIDILVNPFGHWSDNRLGVFSRRAAPVQVSYLIQGLGSGIAAMDYAIADPWVNGGGIMQAHALEKVIDLPGGFQVSGFEKEWPIADAPSADKAITFGSFNNPTKLSDASLALWSDVLRQVPGSRFILKGLWLENRFKRDAVLARMIGHGMDRERIDVTGFLSEDDHMLLHNKVDIMLDTTPFSGGRTTEDALWMGVPVVTLIGETNCGRISYSHLARIGVTELAARTKEEFVALAVALAQDGKRRETYRKTLRDAFKASTMMDAGRHAGELEAAFRTMWRDWCVERAVRS